MRKQAGINLAPFCLLLSKNILVIKLRLCLASHCLLTAPYAHSVYVDEQGSTLFAHARWMSGGQALGAREVISNGLIDWSLKVRRELSDAVMLAAYAHADNVILHIHPAAAQAVTATLPPIHNQHSTYS